MMVNYRSLLTATLASTLILSGCGGGSDSPSTPRLVGSDDTPPPTPQEEFCDDVSSVFQVEANGFSPATNQQDVALNSDIRVTFNALIDEATATSSAIYVQGGSTGVVPAQITVNDDTITLTPDNLLEAGLTQYRIVVTSSLQAECEEVTKNAQPESSTFTTSDQQDLTQPTIVGAIPVDGELLASADTTVAIEFDEPISASSVNVNSFKLFTVQSGATPAIPGTFSFDKNVVSFKPDTALDGQTNYQVELTTNIKDQAGNSLSAPFQMNFRTGGLVLALNDDQISQIPGLGDGLNLLTGQLLELLEIGDANDGLSSADNLLQLKLPLVDNLSSLDPSTFDPTDLDFGDFNTGDFSSVLVAVCDPKDIDPSSPEESCTVSLDVGLDATQLQTLADAFTGGDPTQIPALLGQALVGENNGLGIDLAVLDDSGLPLPSSVQDGLDVLLDGLGQLPVLGDLLNQADGQALANVGLLEGSVLSLDTGGDLLNVSVIDPENLTENGGLVSVGGELVDLLQLDLLLDNVTCNSNLPFGLLCKG